MKRSIMPFPIPPSLARRVQGYGSPAAVAPQQPAYRHPPSGRFVKATPVVVPRAPRHPQSGRFIKPQRSRGVGDY